MVRRRLKVSLAAIESLRRLLCAATALLIGFVAPAGAHDVPPSIVMLDIGRTTIDLELQLPLADLGAALSLPLTDRPDQVVAVHGARIAGYLVSRLILKTRSGEPYSVHIESLQLTRHEDALGSAERLVVRAQAEVPDGGSTPLPSTYGGYSAHTGYDLATGLGTVDAAKLVAAWVGLTPTTTTITAPATTAVSTPVTLTATVTSGSASGTTPIAGTITFAFHNLAGDAGTPYATVDAGGGIDESWVLGTVNVTAVAGSPEKATATLVTTIPPGLQGESWVGAAYSGDTHYLASRSIPQAQVGVTGATLAITPATLTLAPNAITTLTATGGAPGVTWTFASTDTSCLVLKDAQGNPNYICSSVESTSPTTAAFQAGGKAGSVTIGAIDTLGEEARIVITVAGTPVDAGAGLPVVDDAGPPGGPAPGPTPDGGTFSGDDDSGTEDGGLVDASTVDGGNPSDAGTATDAGTGKGGGGDSGCGCVVAGADHSGMGSREAGLGGLLLGLVVLGRRRARRR